MNTHNIYFCGEIRKMFTFQLKKMPYLELSVSILISFRVSVLSWGG